jgi:hypothetical protein
MKSAVRSFLPLASLALLLACGDDGKGADDNADTTLDDGQKDECVDQDGDGFGEHCSEGADCDDADDTVFEECGTCSDPSEGCECDGDSPAIECQLTPDQVVEDSLLCETGMRYCREGLWTACIGVAAFD